MYSGAVMTILLCHEMGHFVQAWRYGVYASLPYFIPMPLTPIGTFGAVIAMEPRRGDRKAIFDIGISGPLAGLVPTFFFLVLGLHWSQSAAGPRRENMVLRRAAAGAVLHATCSRTASRAAASSCCTRLPLPAGWAC